MNPHKMYLSSLISHVSVFVLKLYVLTSDENYLCTSAKTYFSLLLSLIHRCVYSRPSRIGYSQTSLHYRLFLMIQIPNGPNSVDASPGFQLRTKTDPISQTTYYHSLEGKQSEAYFVIFSYVMMMSVRLAI